MAEWEGSSTSSVSGQISAHPRSALVVGLLLIVLGAAAMLMPRASTIAVNVIVGWLLLLSGEVYGWSAFSMHGGWQIAGTVALAVLSVAVGVLLLVFPLRGAITLTLVMSVFFLASGGAKLYGAIRNRLVRGWWWGVISGVASLAIAGLIFAGWPAIGTWALGLLVGVDLIFSGAALIALSFVLKSDTSMR